MSVNLEEDINKLKEKLYLLMGNDDNMNAEIILECSQELDRLITQFYKICKKDS